MSADFVFGAEYYYYAELVYWYMLNIAEYLMFNFLKKKMKLENKKLNPFPGSYMCKKICISINIYYI